MIQRQLIPIIILTLLATQAIAGQKPTFSVASDEVRVAIHVTENGKPVGNLGSADFEIFDNGVPQEIQYAKFQQQMPLSTTLVFDMSQSVEGSLLFYLKQASFGLLADFKERDLAALITFNNKVVLASPFTRDFKQVKQVLDRTQPFGNTSLIDASYAGLVLAKTKSEQSLIIIFSDGQDTTSWLTSEAVLKTAKRNEVVVYAVSTDLIPKKTFLDDLTDLTGGSLFQVESITDLPSVFLGILKEFRQRYLVTYTPRGVTESGWHKLDVRVKNRPAKVRARTGYMRSPVEKRDK
jgi:VWFA-related protein